MPQLARLGALYALAIVAGFLVDRLGLPLAWMIGPMVMSGGLAVAGLAPSVPHTSRSAGQVIVASAVGLYFTSDALTEVLAQAPYMIGAAVGTIAAGGAAAVLLARLARTDPATALFASVPGGPVEMAQMAEEGNGDGAAVALAQTLRIAAIVLIIPPALLWLGDVAPMADGLGGGPVILWALPLFLAVTAGTGIIFRHLRIANPLFLGPLAASALLTAGDVHLTAIPAPLLAAGQILLGVSLGTRFDRALLGRAPRFLAATALTTAILLGCCAGLAWAISLMSGHPLPEMILATAPGSVTEMALTAKGLHLGVASVTAFHIVRIFIIMPLTPLMLRLLVRHRRRHSATSVSMGDD